MSVVRKCVCCDKEYEFCPSCKKKDQPAWMVSFCSEPCKGLFNVISAYNAKRIGKGAVQAYIAEHKITDFTKYTPSIKKVLEEATGTIPMPKVEISKVDTHKVEKPKAENLPKVDIVTETKVETPQPEPIAKEVPVIEAPIVEAIQPTIVTPPVTPSNNLDDHQRSRIKRRRRR